MRVLLTLGVCGSVLTMFAGGVALAVTGPFWLCVLYGAGSARGVYQALEALESIWK